MKQIAQNSGATPAPSHLERLLAYVDARCSMSTNAFLYMVGFMVLGLYAFAGVIMVVKG